MALHYSSLYTLHDDMFTRKRQETTQLREREEKRQRLATQYNEMSELPALSSFMQIEEAAEEAAQLDTGSSAATANKTVVRDGFERMQR